METDRSRWIPQRHPTASAPLLRRRSSAVPLHGQRDAAPAQVPGALEPPGASVEAGGMHAAEEKVFLLL